MFVGLASVLHCAFIQAQAQAPKEITPHYIATDYHMQHTHPSYTKPNQEALPASDFIAVADKAERLNGGH